MVDQGLQHLKPTNLELFAGTCNCNFAGTASRVDEVSAHHVEPDSKADRVQCLQRDPQSHRGRLREVEHVSVDFGDALVVRVVPAKKGRPEVSTKKARPWERDEVRPNHVIPLPGFARDPIESWLA